MVSPFLIKTLKLSYHCVLDFLGVISNNGQYSQFTLQLFLIQSRTIILVFFIITFDSLSYISEDVDDDDNDCGVNGGGGGIFLHFSLIFE